MRRRLLTRNRFKLIHWFLKYPLAFIPLLSYYKYIKSWRPVSERPFCPTGYQMKTTIEREKYI